MKQKSTFVIVIGLLVSSLVYSQDIHFTNYSYSPLYISPAKTGDFAGTYRAGANVRDQFSSFIEKPYQTAMAFADMPIDFGLKPHHWIGAGINVYADRSGDLNFQHTGAHLSLAYHYAIDPKYKTVISLGLQFGMTQRSIDDKNYNSGLTLAGLDDDDLLLLQGFNPSISDFNVGLGLKKWTSKTAYFNIGASMYHLMQSEFQFSGSSTLNPVDRRINGYAEYHIQSSKKLAFKPLIVYSRMYQFQNLFGQLNLEYKPNKKSTTILRGGLGYRTGDAIQFLAGMMYKGWDIGIAYDFTVSSAAQFNNNFGGIELGLKKIFITNKKPKIIPVLLCPTL